MNQIKPESIYVKSIGGSIKRIKNEKGDYLYDYLDLCREILLPDRARNQLFYNLLAENEREEITIDIRPVKFITNEGFKRILYKHITVLYEKGMDIYDEISTLELREETDIIRSIKDLPNSTATEIVDGIYNIYHSYEYKDQLYKFHPEIKEKEELTEMIYEDLYLLGADIEQINVKMTKRPDADNPETREILYKKHKGVDSTCPEWISYIMK